MPPIPDGCFPDSELSQSERAASRRCSSVRVFGFAVGKLSRERWPVKSCTARVQADLTGHARHLVGASRLYLVRAV